MFPDYLSVWYDYDFSKFPFKIFSKKDINLGLSNHQLTFRTRIIFDFKSGDIYNYINFRSLKNYRVDDYKKNTE